MYSGTNEMKLKINKKDKQKYPSIWKLKTIPLNNPCVKEEILRKVRKYSKQMVMKTHLNLFFFAYSWISVQWEVYSVKYISQKSL